MHPEYFRVRFRTEDAVDDWPDSFAIITAFATTGETWTDAQNSEADARLEGILKNKAEWVKRVTGYSPETGHAEPGWAVQLEFDEACSVGLEFKQDAIYFIRAGDLFVSRCDSSRLLNLVGVFFERLTGD